MKLKLTVFFTAFLVTLGLLLGPSAAQETTVIFDPNNPTQATGIENLDIGGTLYNVAFTPPQTVAAQVYGLFPGTFDFDTNQAAADAAEAVNAALNEAGALTVGAEGSGGVQFYRIGFLSDTVLDEFQAVFFWEAARGDGDIQLEPWFRNADPDVDSYNLGVRMWANFLVPGAPQPDPVTIGGTVSGLVGSGLVLENNGRDDETITENGEFTFDTPLTPGTFYSVTVASNPTSPAQTCSVANGSGQVPTENVTDVAVTCAEPILGDLVKVAAEGDTLGGTVLETILLDGGVGINRDSQVAFIGKDDDGTIAAFTQAGLVVAVGETLPDGTTLDEISRFGEVAISAVESVDKVAFHGQDDNNTDAVFTQAERVAAEGDTLSGGTLDEINDEGKVAINDFDQVAFHGSVEIEGGLFDEKFRAVFTSDGQTTQVVAQEGSELPGGTVEEINESGGVAINDFDVVAFHGRVVDPDPDLGGDTFKAVFTSDGLVVREASELPDGNTLDDINEDGGVAINVIGDVAFHGSVIDAAAGSDSVKAVFTQAGLVAKEGQILPDNTPLDEINVSSGVAINLFGDVVFHGRTGGVKAVFTQNGLVAKVGDNLTDGTTLKEINDSAGVAINTYGLDVAFHGEVDDPDDPGSRVDAVFVGKAPVVE